MARPLRIQFAGALYHVTSRGNAREPIFTGDDDRRSFLGIVGEAIERHRWLCHASRPTRDPITRSETGAFGS